MTSLDQLIKEHHLVAGKMASRTSSCSANKDWLTECKRVGRKFTTRVEKRLRKMEERSWARLRAKRAENRKREDEWEYALGGNFDSNDRRKKRVATGGGRAGGKTAKEERGKKVAPSYRPLSTKYAQDQVV